MQKRMPNEHCIKNTICQEQTKGIVLLCYLTVKDSYSNELYRVLHSTSIDTLNKVQTKIPTS